MGRDLVGSAIGQQRLSITTMEMTGEIAANMVFRTMSV